MEVISTQYPAIKLKSVCIKHRNAAGTKEVSVAADNSLGAFETLPRCDIRCYGVISPENPELARNLTFEVFGTHDDVSASNANLRKALEWLGD